MKQPLREIIVSHADESNTLQLYRIKEDGSSRRKITNSKHDSMMPAWSPDGNKVVFVRHGSDGMNLWISDPNGIGAEAITHSEGNVFPCWLPDSKHIVWTQMTPGKNPCEESRLLLMDTDSKQYRPLFSDSEQLRFSNSMGVVSPDGRQVAFVSNRSGKFRIWLSNFDGSGSKPISPTPWDDDATHRLPIEQKVPHWSPDGKWIAHWEGVQENHVGKRGVIQDRETKSLVTATGNICIVGRDGKNKRNVGQGKDPIWSPDGLLTRASLHRSKGRPKIMVERESGMAEIPIIPDHSRRHGRLTWKPEHARDRMIIAGMQARATKHRVTHKHESETHTKTTNDLSVAEAQTEFYRLDEVQTIRLQIEQEDIERLLTALPKRIYVPATFQWRDKIVDKVAVRFKGNSSSQPNQPHKRSFLIKFNEYEEDARFLGMRRVSFDNGIQFGSLFSEPVITKILRDQGIKTYRCNYARIFLNGQHHGVYVNVERLDESFIESHLADADGQLFKVDEGGPGCNLQFLGENPSLYEKTFEAKSKSAKKNHQNLVEFIRLINQVDASHFAAELENRMEVDDFLRVAATLLFSGAFDQLTGWAPHNYYLYHDTIRNRWRYMPWDLDVGFCETAFGRISVLAEWHAAWPVAPSGRPNPLMERIVADPLLLQRYRELAGEILEQHFNPDRLCEIIDANYERIKEDLALDPFPHQRATAPNDRSYDSIVKSIKSFVRKRYSLAAEQLEAPGPPPTIVRRPATGLPPRLAEKLQQIEQRISRWQRESRVISSVHQQMEKVPPLLQQGKIAEAEKVFDQLLQLLDENLVPLPATSPTNQ